MSIFFPHVAVVVPNGNARWQGSSKAVFLTKFSEVTSGAPRDENSYWRKSYKVVQI